VPVPPGDHQRALGIRERGRDHHPDLRQRRGRLRGPADRAGAGGDARGARRRGERRGGPARRGRDRRGGSNLMAAPTVAETTPRTVAARSRARPRWLKQAGRWLAILLMGGCLGFPLYWTLTMAFKPEDEWNPPGKV